MNARVEDAEDLVTEELVDFNRTLQSFRAHVMDVEPEPTPKALMRVLGALYETGLRSAIVQGVDEAEVQALFVEGQAIARASHARQYIQHTFEDGVCTGCGAYTTAEDG